MSTHKKKVSSKKRAGTPPPSVTKSTPISSHRPAIHHSSPPSSTSKMLSIVPSAPIEASVISSVPPPVEQHASPDNHPLERIRSVIQSGGPQKEPFNVDIKKRTDAVLAGLLNLVKIVPHMIEAGVKDVENLGHLAACDIKKLTHWLGSILKWPVDGKCRASRGIEAESSKRCPISTQKGGRRTRRRRRRRRKTRRVYKKQICRCKSRRKRRRKKRKTSKGYSK